MPQNLASLAVRPESRRSFWAGPDLSHVRKVPGFVTKPATLLRKVCRPRELPPTFTTQAFAALYQTGSATATPNGRTALGGTWRELDAQSAGPWKELLLAAAQPVAVLDTGLREDRVHDASRRQASAWNL